MKASEKLKIIDNIIARSGGIENIDLYGELAKATSMMNSFTAQQQMSDMQNMASMTPPQAQGSMISPEMGQTIPQAPQEPTMPQNEGNGTMQLPM